MARAWPRYSTRNLGPETNLGIEPFTGPDTTPEISGQNQSRARTNLEPESISVKNQFRARTNLGPEPISSQNQVTGLTPVHYFKQLFIYLFVGLVLLMLHGDQIPFQIVCAFYVQITVHFNAKK